MEVKRSINEPVWILVWDWTVNGRNTLQISPFCLETSRLCFSASLLDCVDLWGSSIKITPTTEPHQLTARQCSVRGCIVVCALYASSCGLHGPAATNRGKCQWLSLPNWAFFPPPREWGVQECEGLSRYSCCVSVQKTAAKLSVNYLVIYLAFFLKPSAQTGHTVNSLNLNCKC